MKKLFIILSCGLLLCTTSSKAQITLDTALANPFGISYSFKLVQISSTETKWYFCDTLNNTFSLYNMDFTPFITSIAVPEPFDPYNVHMQALYITRTLFDCDSTNIEYAYYTTQNIGKSFKVLRTDGTILFQRDSVNGPYAYGSPFGGTDVVRPIVNTSSGAKLFLQPFPLQDPIYVYSLCGTLPVDVFDFTELETSFVRVFPNPTSNSLSFRIEAPDNINEYELIIRDSNANEMRREKIKSQNNNMSIDVSDFSSGLYYYSLSTKGKSFKAGKFILTK